MTFVWGSLLWMLLAIPVLSLTYILAQRRRNKYALRYSSLSLVKDSMGRGPGFRRHIPPIILLLGLSAMIISVARPVAVLTIPSEEGTVILAIDVSGSMAAEDLKPNRLEAAKAAARAFVDRQSKDIRIGVVSFSDNAFIVQSVTADRDAVLAAINRLSPQRGTAIGRGILTSLDAIYEEANAEDSLFLGTPTPLPFGVTPRPTQTPKPLPKGVYASAIIILLSDGESNSGPAPLDVVDQPKNEGIRIYTVGVGTPEGIILHIQGRSVRVRLDEATMKKIAERTDGEYYRATDEKNLNAIYEKLGKQLVFRTEKTEVTFGFTALGAIFLLMAGALSLMWFNRLP